MRNEILIHNLDKLESFVESSCSPLFGVPPIVYEEKDKSVNAGKNCWKVLLSPIMRLHHKQSSVRQILESVREEKDKYNKM